MDQEKKVYYLGEADLAALMVHIENEGQVEWDRFLDYAEKLSVDPEAVLIRQFECDRDIYILTEGELEIRVAAEPNAPDLTIATVSPIAVVGEQSFIDEGLRSATVATTVPSTVYRLTLDAFDDLCESAPELGCAFLFDVARSLSLRARVYETY